MTLVLAVLVASLLGSPHCAGMCGAFACFAGAGARGAAPQVAYNLGRLTTYLALGALAGVLGAGIDAAGELAGVGRAAAVASGALMVLWGAGRLAAARGVRLPVVAAAVPDAARRRLGGALRALRERPPVVRAAATGLLTTLLPCGWLSAYVITAAGTGGALRGMLVMAAFWAGTLPMLAAVGAGAQRLSGPLARRLPVASAAALVLLGLLSIGGKLSLPRDAHAHGAAPSAAVSAAASATGHAAHDAR